MGRYLHVTFYASYEDCCNETNGIYIEYFEEEQSYHNILFDDRAKDFVGEASDLLNLILELTQRCTSDHVKYDEHWIIASTLRCLWAIYYEFKDFEEVNYVNIEYY